MKFFIPIAILLLLLVVNSNKCISKHCSIQQKSCKDDKSQLPCFTVTSKINRLLTHVWICAHPVPIMPAFHSALAPGKMSLPIKYLDIDKVYQLLLVIFMQSGKDNGLRRRNKPSSAESMILYSLSPENHTRIFMNKSREYRRHSKNIQWL